MRRPLRNLQMLDPVRRKIARHDTYRRCKNVPYKRCVEVDGNEYASERR